MCAHSVPALACRHGTIELVESPSGKHLSTEPGAAAASPPWGGCLARRLGLSPSARKALVWGHLLLINALCIGGPL